MDTTIKKYYGPIAILDILGFKEFIANNSLDSIISEYARVLTGAEFAGKILKEDLEIMVYSDTIAIRLVNMTDCGFVNFIQALHTIIHTYFYKCQMPGHVLLPIRGAISVGEYTWHKGSIWTQILGRDALTATDINFIAGQAILEAHNHESLQEWISISMDTKTESLVNQMYPNAVTRLIEQNLLVRYQVPLKNGCDCFSLVVNPIETYQLGYGIDKIYTLFEDMSGKSHISQSTKLKYHNTQKLIEYLVANKLTFPNVKCLK